MFLKSLEIRGFKSFADKTELVFKKGVTAVVGPNGSGKSNISDAVRWVLGEQSIKSLRGGKMEDVIFSGTQFRKPVGLAQVSLVLDNCDKELPIDYTDVIISRRLYRSGESEYYINNTQCRLKDIQELFMDTGIGKEGYSIIGQGKIEAILSGKPEERRNLLEEAAGIVKFKTRKEEAEKKLDACESNLVRIDDILSTYEERLEPLRVDSEKAKAFLNYSEELKTKEINVIINSIEKIQNKIESIEQNGNDIDTQIHSLLEDRDKLKEESQKLDMVREEFETQTKNEKQQYYDIKTEHQKIISDIDLLSERIENLNKTINRSIDEIKSNFSKITELDLKKLELEKNAKAVREEQIALDTNIRNCEKEVIGLNTSLNEEENLIRNSKDEHIEYLRNISAVKNEITLLENDSQTLTSKSEQIKSSIESYSNNIKINTNTKIMLEKEASKSQEGISKKESEIKSIKETIRNSNQELLEKEREQKNLSISFNKLEANHQMLLNLEKQYEGYNKSVKILMQDISKNKIPHALNKAFVLGEVIDVPKEYETALEIALGAGISDIITEDENIAKELIRYLKTNSVGRATFLPLTTVRSKPISDLNRYKNQQGFIGIASQLIEYDDKFRNAIEYVLGRTIVASNMDTALSIAKLSNYSYKIVTLEGEVINPGGSLTGGSLYHKASNIISRKREIEELGLKIEDLKIQIGSLSNFIENKSKEIKTLDNTTFTLKDEIYNLNIELTKINSKIGAIDVENDRLKKNIEISQTEIAAISQKYSNNSSQKLSKENELKKLEIDMEENASNIKEFETSVEDKKEALLKKREEAAALKIRKAQIDEIISNKIKELERISSDLEELKQKNNQWEKEIESSNALFNSCNEQIKALTLKKDSLESELVKLEENFKESEIKGIKIHEQIRINKDKLDSAILELSKAEEEKHKFEITFTKLETEKEAHYLKLNEEIGLTYAEALKFKEEFFSIEQYKKDIQALKAKISDLGTVNVGAIEEYKDVSEKFKFMNAQKEDLINAKEELISVINNMTDNMRDVFNENFSKLRVLFSETFKELFKGGKADLVLNGEDELSCNIDIIVEPPGKKLQNINLLSGGEKGLSAIALLFSILKMKPTPFCILDEIEAALDDANVNRYAEFLKKFSENTQFIVVTHRKGTMECSDVLYGVTMEEKGVSKVVSVDLAR